MSVWERIKVFVKGTLIGAVNVVPISSGAISLILGVYERFINSIRALNHKNFKYLYKGEFNEFGRRTDFRFFIVLVLGVMVGMVFTSIFLKSVLETEPYKTYTYSFFVGLILASVYNVMRGIQKVTTKNIIILFVGFVISALLSVSLNPNSNDNFWYLFLCGIIGATGMVVPGVSGSHLMLLMGNYELIVTEAIPNLTNGAFMEGFRILLPFALGSVVSIVSFSYLLSWLMREYRNETLSALSGFMLGSVPVVYPWKVPSPDMTHYIFQWPTINNVFFIAVLTAVVGAVAVYVIEMMARRQSKGES